MRLNICFIGIIALFAVSPAFAGSHAQDQPKRVVSTFLCTDEYLYRLLPRSRIAALSFLAGDKDPVVSTIHDRVQHYPLIRPNSETVLSLHPDLVLIYEGTNPRLRAHLQKMGIKVLDVPWANSLADIRNVTTMLGAALHVPHRAAVLLAEMDSDLARAKAKAPQAKIRALIYEPNGYATSGDASSEIMALAGLYNSAGDYRGSRTGAIAIEAVVAARPDLLVLNGQTSRSRGDLLLRHPALKALPKQTHIEWAELTGLLCPGPWSAKVAEPLAELGQKALLARKGAGH